MVCFSSVILYISFVATSVLAIPITPDPVGEKNVGKGDGSQFITGRCTSNADCASQCCANILDDPATGICSGPGAAFQNGKNGCGFSSANAGGNGNQDVANNVANNGANNTVNDATNNAADNAVDNGADNGVDNAADNATDNTADNGAGNDANDGSNDNHKGNQRGQRNQQHNARS